MAKRIFDLTIGSVLLVLALPVIAGVAVVLAVELRAWPFFVHERIGRGGRTFRFLKLRTLAPSTPRYALKHELDEASMSRFRTFLRERHLDELPQLVHVITGKLSLVGPRPRMPDDHEPVDPEYARWRVQVDQGCTGLWQIGAHTGLLPHEHPEYDLLYVRHRTLFLDAWIVARTVLQALGLVGATHLTDIPGWLLDSRPATTPSIVIDIRDPETSSVR